ncbi:hypothetical protein LMG28688_06375 [Paraburkholderia caffeinitolerans]|uniref:Oligosaccharide repeat unit polymerase n=2 Tax=Burkholderiaceae TaxID=119060 RepID=A0A6J5GXG2_9BURK|nr:hypothetical protein LMG28688_06375 [Paraburkholderia caffeinitolerans]
MPRAKISLIKRLANEGELRRSAETGLKRVNPFILFLGIYTAYNIIGLIDTPWTIRGTYDKVLCWKLFVTGLIGFLLAFVFFRGVEKKTVTPMLRQRRSRQLTIFFLLIFIVCLLLTILTSGGIPLFMGEERFGNSAIAFNLIQFYGFWVLVRLISDFENNKKISVIQIAVYIAGVLCFGYRTPVLVFFLVIYVYQIVFRMPRKKAFLFGFVAIFAITGFAAIFAAYRVSQSYDLVTFFGNIDFRYVNDHKYLWPFVPALAMLDFSQNTVSSIGSALHQYMYGGLFISNYETFLPGKHWGARNIIGELTSARWVAGRPMSITPTLQGALYVDFGYIGVFTGFFIISAGIGFFWKKAKRWGALGKFGFCYLLTMSIMSVHNGYWDAGFVFFLIFIGVIRCFDLIKGRSVRFVK